MSLVLANTTSLWKEISTNPMQRPLSSLSHSRAIVTWLLALLWSLLPTHLAAYHPHHVSLRTPASIYLIFHSLSFQKGHSPQGRDHHLQCAVLPLCWFLQMQPTESSHHLFLTRRGWSPSDMFPVISRVLRNTLTSTRTCMGLKGHGRNSPRSLFSPSVHHPCSNSWCRERNRMHQLLYMSLLCTFTFRSQKPRSLWGMTVSAALISVCCGSWCGHQYSETPCTWRMSSRCP